MFLVETGSFVVNKHKFLSTHFARTLQSKVEQEITSYFFFLTDLPSLK